MKILVCGSRDWTCRATIDAWLRKFPAGTTVIHGAAKGADTIAGAVAKALGFTVRDYPADWSEYRASGGKRGKDAGPKRNRAMLAAEHTEAEPITRCLAFTPSILRDIRTRELTGTGDMASLCWAAGIVVIGVPPGGRP